MVEAIQKFGFKVAGFDAYVTTNVIRAAGVSSSASFEMLLCSIINYFFNDGAMTYINYAKAGQFTFSYLGFSLSEKSRRIGPPTAHANMDKIDNDRAILRAIHFFKENERVERAAKAVEEKDGETVLKLLSESGESSWELLQNCTYCADIHWIYVLFSGKFRNIGNIVL